MIGADRVPALDRLDGLPQADRRRARARPAGRPGAQGVRHRALAAAEGAGDLPDRPAPAAPAGERARLRDVGGSVARAVAGGDPGDDATGATD